MAESSSGMDSGMVLKLSTGLDVYLALRLAIPITRRRKDTLGKGLFLCGKFEPLAKT